MAIILIKQAINQWIININIGYEQLLSAMPFEIIYKNIKLIYNHYLLSSQYSNFLFNLY